MIRLDKGNVALEGQLGDLMIEAARILDAVALAVEKKADEKEVNYDVVIGTILDYLGRIKKISHEDNVWSYEDELKFLQEARDLRKELSRSPDDVIDFDVEVSPLQAPAQTSKKNALTKKKKNLENLEIKESLSKPRDPNLKSTLNISGGAKLGDFIIDSRVSDEDLMDLEDIKAIKDLKNLQRKSKR